MMPRWRRRRLGVHYVRLLEQTRTKIEQGEKVSRWTTESCLPALWREISAIPMMQYETVLLLVARRRGLLPDERMDEVTTPATYGRKWRKWFDRLHHDVMGPHDAPPRTDAEARQVAHRLQALHSNLHKVSRVETPTQRPEQSDDVGEMSREERLEAAIGILVRALVASLGKKQPTPEPEEDNPEMMDADDQDRIDAIAGELLDEIDWEDA